jgi:hypothetical protein
MRFFRAIAGFFKEIKVLLVSMMTGPNGDVSSKRVNGTILIQAAIVLGFFIAFHKAQAVALEVVRLFLYVGAAILGVGNLMENIRIGGPSRQMPNNTVSKGDYNAEGVKINGPGL